MRNLVKRLEAQRDYADDWRTLLCEEAAEEIERLERELSLALEELDEEYRVVGKFMEEIERLQQQNNRSRGRQDRAGGKIAREALKNEAHE
jgi:hypothetical protein